MQQTSRPQLIIFFISLVFFISCGQPPVDSNSSASKIEPKTAGKSGGNLSVRLTAAPKTFNYLLAEDEASVVAAFFLMTSRMIEFDHRTQKYIPALAESWTVNADGKTVDIKLRSGLKFSDGNDLTADDVVFTLKAVYDEKTNSPVYRSAMLIEGKMIEIKKIDELNLQVIFPTKVAAAENYLDNLGILPSHILESELNSGKLAEAWKINSDPAAIVTSGPFSVESTTPGERIVLKRNANYWKKDEAGTSLPYLDNLTVEIISDPNNTFARLEQGSIDIADRIRPTDFTALTARKGAVQAFDIGAGLGTDHLWFNLNQTSPDGKPLDNKIKFAWFNNKEFRHAVSSAIDRESLSAVTLQGLASPLYGFVSPANKVWANPAIAKTAYDLANSKELLKTGGFELRGTAETPELFDAQGNRVEFTLLVPAENEPRKLMAAVIQQDLARLGIKMQIAPVDLPTLTQRWSKSFDYDAILMGLGVTGIEPTTYANFLLSGSSVHQWRPNQKTPATEWEARIDKLFAEQAGETDQAKRAVIFNEIQMIVASELPVIPIASRHIVSGVNARTGNFAPSAMLPYSLWNADELFIK